MTIELGALLTMKPEIKAEWLKRLRSGNIPQTPSVLHRIDNGAMCCLGVLSEVAYDAGIVDRTEGRTSIEDDDAVPVYVYVGNVDEDRFDKSDFGLTQTVCHWADFIDDVGSTTSLGLLPFSGREDTKIYLADLNDGGMSFDQIADIIEYWY